MDLTTHFPRSPRERLRGVAMLPRTIDKARAAISEQLGEYIYDCPMDRRLFSVLGIDAAEFLKIIRDSADDAAVEARLRARASWPSGDALNAHNSDIEHWAPTTDDGRRRFTEQRRAVAPNRDDITTWTDLIDLEEGRMALADG